MDGVFLPDDVTAIRLPKDDRTLRLLSDLFVQKHVFPVLDKRVKTFVGAHRLFKNIENGFVRVYGAFYQGRIIGVCFGHLENEHDFCTHVAFCRHSRVLDGCFACADAMINEFSQEGVEIKNIVGYIPDYNKAAQRLARRFGCKDHGINENKTIVEDYYEVPCRVMKKELR